jgi:hypothetical protein
LPTLTRSDMGKKESVRTMLFSEAQSLHQASVNRVKKTVEVTLIEPGWSVNGRYYSPETLKQAIPVFEGAKCYVNHPTMSEEKERPERSVDDIAGYYTGVRQADDGRLTATLNVVGVRGENIYPLVVEAVEKKPDLVGLSINALGKTRTGEAQGRTGVIVDEIVKAFGTDIVTTPSAGGKFDRLMQSGDEMTAALLRSLEFDEWRNANPDFLARIKKEMRTLRKEELESAALREAAFSKEQNIALSEKLRRKTTRIKELKERVRGLKEALANQERETANRVSEAVADYKLLASKLPEKWAKPLRESLLGRSPEEMDALIDLEKQKYFSVKEPVQVFNAGAPAEESADFIPPEQSVVLGALHAEHTVLPRDDESPEEYAARKRKILGA